VVAVSLMKIKAAQRPSVQRVTFVVLSADGMGGVSRTVNNVASKLAERHDVEIVSMFRRRDEPHYPLDARVRLTYLTDERTFAAPAAEARPERVREPREQPNPPAWQKVLRRGPTRLVQPASGPPMSTLTDVLLWRKLRALPPGIIISPFQTLCPAVARWAPSHHIKVAQEHLNLRSRLVVPSSLDNFVRDVLDMDCLVTLTETDAADYARHLRGRVMVKAIPNAVPWSPNGDTGSREPVVVAAGRLVEQKGFDRLIAAYEPLAAAYPDWQLHIYGKGQQRRALSRLIRQRGLTDQVQLKGYKPNLREVFSGASVYAMTSRYEGFPMVLLEAMSVGLPLVSFDCPTGPAEMIDDGRNGRLVPDGEVTAFTNALAELMADAELRRRMGVVGRRTVEQYTVNAVGARWERLFDELAARRAPAARV